MSNFTIIGRVAHAEPVAPIEGADFIALTRVGMRDVVVKRIDFAHADPPGDTDHEPRPGLYLYIPEDAILPMGVNIPQADAENPEEQFRVQVQRDLADLTDFLVKVKKNGVSVKPPVEVRRYRGVFSVGVYLRVDEQRYPALASYIITQLTGARDANQVTGARDTGATATTVANPAAEATDADAETTTEADTDTDAEAETFTPTLVDDVSVTLDPAYLRVGRREDDIDVSEGSGGSSSVDGLAVAPRSVWPKAPPSHIVPNGSLLLQKYDVANAWTSDILSQMIEAVKADPGLRLHVTEKLEGMNARAAFVYHKRPEDGSKPRFPVPCVGFEDAAISGYIRMQFGTRQMWQHTLLAPPQTEHPEDGYPLITTREEYDSYIARGWRLGRIAETILRAYVGTPEWDPFVFPNLVPRFDGPHNLGYMAPTHARDFKDLWCAANKRSLGDVDICREFDGCVIGITFGEAYGSFVRGKGDKKVRFRYDLPEDKPLGFRIFETRKIVPMLDNSLTVVAAYGFDFGFAFSAPVPLHLNTSQMEGVTPESIAQYAEGNTELQPAPGQATHVREGVVVSVVRSIDGEIVEVPIRGRPTRLIGKIVGKGYLALKHGV